MEAPKAPCRHCPERQEKGPLAGIERPRHNAVEGGMSRRPNHIPPRKAIPKETVRTIMGRSNGRCEYIGGCTEVGAEIDHIIPQALGGSNEAENLALLCQDHHAEKTKLDVNMIAKADRQGGRAGRQKRRKDKPKMKGRGFQGWRKFDGSIVYRD
jgi:5-methylcytosine-specific restriction endonuclease McrA